MDINMESPVSVGLAERAVAYLIDSVVTVIISGLALLITSLATGVEGYYVDVVDLLLHLILSYCYFMFLPLLWNGHTVGKRIMGIKIASVNGEKLTLTQTLIRGIFHAVFYLLGWILVVVSIVLIAVRDDKRALHDILTSTYVSYSR